MRKLQQRASSGYVAGKCGSIVLHLQLEDTRDLWSHSGVRSSRPCTIEGSSYIYKVLDPTTAYTNAAGTAYFPNPVDSVGHLVS